MNINLFDIDFSGKKRNMSPEPAKNEAILPNLSKYVVKPEMLRNPSPED